MITTRVAIESDRNFLWQLKQETMKEYIGKTYSWDEQNQYDWFHSNFVAAALTIVEYEGKAVGMYELTVREQILFLSRFEVTPTHQCKGIGTAVLNKLKAMAEEKAMALQLQVFNINPAKQLYLRSGFKALSSNKTHTKMEYLPSNYR